jgi:hypothetical protein
VSVPLEEFGDSANARRVQPANVRALAYRVITRNGEFCAGLSQDCPFYSAPHLAFWPQVSSLYFERSCL